MCTSGVSAAGSNVNGRDTPRAPTNSGGRRFGEIEHPKSLSPPWGACLPFFNDGLAASSETHTLGSDCDWRLTKRYPVSDQIRMSSFCIEDVIAFVGDHREHGMTFLVLVAYYSHEQ